MKKLILLLLSAASLYATVGAKTVWQIQSTAAAANANGGGFDYGDNANMATDLACTSATGNAPVCTSASYNFVAGDVNAWLYVASGTNWTPGWYQIASVASNAATVTATIGTAQQIDTTKGFPTPKWGLNTVAGVATVASPTGGTWSVDYSQQDTAGFAGTDLASANGTTNPATVTSAAHPLGVNWVGNVIHITAGTNWTQSWYEIVSVSVITGTLDRAVGSVAALSSGTYKLGGAISFGSSTASQTDANFVGSAQGAVPTTGGNRYFIKAANYTMATNAWTTAAGGTQLPHSFEGYNVTRGDTPTGANRPTLNFTTAAAAGGTNADFYNIIIIGTAAPVFTAGGASKNVNCKFVNSSTTAGRVAIVSNGGNISLINIEAVSYFGNALNISATTSVFGSYFHDSNICVQDSGTSPVMIVRFNILEGCVTAAYQASAATTGMRIISSNTLYGAENKLGIGISIPAGGLNFRLEDNILYGFITGISDADVQFQGYGDYNDLFNNTTNLTNWQMGANSVTLNPTFTNVHQYTGTTATSSTNVLTDSGANFANVVNNQDFCYLVSGTGTGFTAGDYLITSHTSTTLTLSSNITSSGSGSAITYQVTYGHNFAIGTNLKALGFPGAFQAALSTGYLDIGAVQRQEAGAAATVSLPFIQ